MDRRFRGGATQRLARSTPTSNVRGNRSLRSLEFPLVAKPDLGRRGVRRIGDVAALREYLRNFPGGARLMLQRFVPHAGKAAVLYARLPGAQSGRILSLTFRVDGPGLPRRAPAYRAGARGAHRRVARSMSEFHYGRFDLRFARPKISAWREFLDRRDQRDRQCDQSRPRPPVAARRSLPPPGRPATDHIPDRRAESRAASSRSAVPTSSNPSSARASSAAAIRPRPELPFSTFCGWWTRPPSIPTLTACTA